jgi:hypothetical protein
MEITPTKDILPTSEPYRFTLWTDGSGCNVKENEGAGFMGSCAIIQDNLNSKIETRVSAGFAGSVYRAEFEALLLGLQGILEIGGWDGNKEALDKTSSKPTICWYTDCQSLFMSVLRDPETGLPVYGRKACGDLWARFGYYETAFFITPNHIKRNSLPEQALADRVSGECRLVISDYLYTLQVDSVLSL